MSNTVNNAILAAAIGMISIGVVGVLPNVELPDLPTPTPDDPPGPLAQFVTEDQRPLLAQFFRDFATIVETDTAAVLDSTDKLRNAQQAASQLLVQAGSLPANAALRAELERRQVSTFGVESRPIAAALRPQLAAFYRQIAEDF